MGHMNILLYLIQHGAGIDTTTVRGETALHLAARANQTDVMRILLRNGAQVDARARVGTWLLDTVIGCLRDPANVQHYICWKFAGRLLGRVNTPLQYGNMTSLQRARSSADSSVAARRKEPI